MTVQEMLNKLEFNTELLNRGDYDKSGYIEHCVKFLVDVKDKNLVYLSEKQMLFLMQIVGTFSEASPLKRPPKN